MPEHGDFRLRTPHSPANLKYATSGGQWQDGDKDGHVRFCAFQRGYEHVRHQVVIEWVQSPTDPNEEQNIVSRLVVEDIPEVWSIGQATIVMKDDKTFIQFEGANSYAPEKKARFSIEVQGVGKAKVTTTE